MRARRKGTNNPYTRVEKIQLQDLDILYDADVMEFESHPIEMSDTLSTELNTNSQIANEAHWQDVRERAAMAALTGTLADTNTAGSYDSFAEAAVAYADALVERLKEKLKEE